MMQTKADDEVVFWAILQVSMHRRQIVMIDAD